MRYCQSTFLEGVMYQFKNQSEHDNEGHFWFDRMLIENKNWMLLSAAGKAVYPVIASYRNGSTGEAFPSERTIASLSGRSDKTVRQGIRQLDGFPGISCRKYRTRTGKMSKKFTVAQPEIGDGASFPFFKSVFEGGLWSELTPTAQALYPVMRCLSGIEYELYMAVEDDDCLERGDFLKRKWDLCEAPKSLLSDLAGINYRSVNEALKCLEKCDLAKPFNYDGIKGYKVTVRPYSHFKPRYLNEKLSIKYQHLRN